MRLTELEPQLVKILTMRDGDVGSYDSCPMAEAQGILFLCPKCFAENHGNIGTHSVLCWSRSRGVVDTVHPRPGRWALVGTGLDDLTLDADPPGTARSVQLLGGCGWHGFITNGEVT